MQSSFGTKQAEVWVISTYRLEKPRPTRFIWLITLTHSPVTTYHLPLPKGQKHAHKFSPSMAASFTTLVNPPSLLLLIFLSRLPRFLGNQTDIEFLIFFFSFLSLTRCAWICSQMSGRSRVHETCTRSGLRVRRVIR
jgi:threonine/homoserine/homoserine lactone efflux protein